MDKELKRSYVCLDLPFNATEQEVRIRSKALIKIYENRSRENGVSYDKRIGRIEWSAIKILDNIKKNGIPKEKDHCFDSSWKSISILTTIMAFVGLLCFFSFYILL